MVAMTPTPKTLFTSSPVKDTATQSHRQSTCKRFTIRVNDTSQRSHRTSTQQTKNRTMVAPINCRFELKFHKIFVQFPLMKMTRRHYLNSRREIRRRSRRIVWKASAAAGAYDHHRKRQTPSFSIMSQFGVWRAAFFTTKSGCRMVVRNVVERTPNVPSDFNACTERGRWSDVTWQQHENAYTHNGCKEDNGGDRDYDEDSQWLRRILLRHYSLCAWANDSLRDISKTLNQSRPTTVKLFAGICRNQNKCRSLDGH